MSNYNDNPISNPDDDLFAYQHLATSIAACIRNLENPDGTVIGIHGPWGSGKSSMLNLVERELKENTHPTAHASDEQESLGEANSEIEIVQIQTWMYRTEDALIMGLCKEMYFAFEKGVPEIKHKKLKQFLYKLFMSPDTSMKLLRIGSGDLSALTGLASSVANASRQEEETLDTERFNVLQTEVSQILEKSSKRILIVLDDIDRLPPDEVLAVLRTIKSIGRLPTVIYLLSYDESVLAKLIEKKHHESGKAFLEKIVQASFPVPAPNESDLGTMLHNFLWRAFSDENSRIRDHLLGTRYDSSGESSNTQLLLANIVIPLMHTPRDVIRYTNTVKITWGAVDGQVSVGDFLALEAFRIFEPDVYHSIKSIKNCLVWVRAREVDADKNALRLSRRNSHMSSLKALGKWSKEVSLIFPEQTITATPQQIDHDLDDAQRRRRVIHPDHFDIYFAFSTMNSYKKINQQKYSAHRSRVDHMLKTHRDV